MLQYSGLVSIQEVRGKFSRGWFASTIYRTFSGRRRATRPVRAAFSCW